LRHRRLSVVLDLELAWRRVKQDQYDDFVPDVVEFRDVEQCKTTVLSDIEQALDRGYIPVELLRIDAPKKGYTLRPCTYMTVEDRIVYQAVVDHISCCVEEPPADCVFGYRLNNDMKSKYMFKFWKEVWLEGRKKMRNIYENGYRCLLRTDITAYFEQIDHRILRNQILDAQVKDKRVLDLLNTLLHKWAISDTRIGIPQGYDASSFLGNLYLINLDKIMSRQGLRYFRYSDEIYVLTMDEPDARRAIKLITQQLRALHLNLQEAKTEIITAPERITKEIGSDDEDKRRDFDYQFIRKVQRDEIEEVEEAEDEIVKQYKKVTGNGKAKKVEISDLKWCVNKLRRLKNDKAAQFMLKSFTRMPVLADLCFEYLQLFINRERIKEGIVNFLDSTNNIYEWQEMWLLLTLSKARRLRNIQLDVLRGIIRNSSKAIVSRGAAILVLGKLGDSTDRKWLVDLYQNEDNSYIKRAIAVSVYGMPKAARNAFYSSIQDDSPAMMRLVQYLKRDHIETI